MATKVMGIYETKRQRLTTMIVRARAEVATSAVIALNRVPTIVPTEVEAAIEQDTIRDTKESKTVQTVDVIGCKRRERGSPIFMDVSTCNISGVPGSLLDASRFQFAIPGQSWRVRSLVRRCRPILTLSRANLVRWGNFGRLIRFSHVHGKRALCQRKICPDSASRSRRLCLRHVTILLTWSSRSGSLYRGHLYFFSQRPEYGKGPGHYVCRRDQRSAALPQAGRPRVAATV